MEQSKERFSVCGIIKSIGADEHGKPSIQLSDVRELELLRTVVDFKKKFYLRGWACYDDAKPGSLKLIPPAYRLEDLSKDYADMQQMFFANSPEFEEMMEYIQELERDINML